MDSRERRDFGSVRKLPSGKWQARWKLGGTWYSARLTDDDGYDIGALTFSTRTKATRHLEWVAREVEAGRWRPPVKRPRNAAAPSSLRAYADEWMDRRDIKPTTREHDRRVLDKLILPKLGDLDLSKIDQDAMDRWYGGLDAGKKTYRAHAYQILRQILADAARRKIIAEVPSIDGAGKTQREREIHLLEPAEVAALAKAMPEQYRAMVLISAWCALRYGEATALTAGDVDLERGLLHVRRGVTRTKGEWHVSAPKNGRTRTVPIAPHITDDLKAHVAGLAPGDLLFPAPRGGYMIAPTFGKMYAAAAKKIGRPDVRVHDLRHFGGVRFAMAGATLAELMEFGGWLTVQAAARYFNIAAGRMGELTARMSAMASASPNVVPIDSERREKVG